MEIYLQGFVNFKHNNLAKLIPRAKFAYNKAKIASAGHMPFKLNSGYHFCVFLKKISSLALNQNQQTSYPRNYKIWWLFAKKIGTMLKNFASKLTIKASSLKATFLAIKFG